MESPIGQSLNKLFEKHRIVFWYDHKRELRHEFETLVLDSVEKIELINNEFGVKYRVLRQEPKQKFLLYRDGPPPADLDNWLLDVQLAQGEFRGDQGAMWLTDLGLGLEFVDIVQDHAAFFQAKSRKESLKRLLKSDDTRPLIWLKMLAVCVGAEARLDSILENLLAELAKQQDEKIKLVHRCGLESFLWQQMKKIYGYEANESTLNDFVIQLFKQSYFQHFPTASNVSPKPLSPDALVFLKRWQDSRTFAPYFDHHSQDCDRNLNIEQDLSNRDFRDLISLDYFRSIDRKIIGELVRGITDRAVTGIEVEQWIRQRRQSHWYKDFQHLYEALDYAAQFIQTLAQVDLLMDSLHEGIQKYSQVWFRLDQFYRKFIYHFQCSGEVSLLSTLADNIENLYSNHYLLTLGNHWQEVVDRAEAWTADPIPRQDRFFERWVNPFLKKDKKVCVIISDALRYEIGEEFLRLIRQEDRYEATLEPSLTLLPSFTQLGMAALLPHTSLAFAENDTGTVLVGEQSSQGTANRDKLLKKSMIRGTALQSEAFLGMNRDEARELFKAHNVIYLYHNRIDHTGDKIQSEGQAFEAAEQTLEELLKLVKKLTAANASNIIVTADHGFIYQHRAIADSDFLSQDVTGDHIFYRDRRFILGKGLKQNNSVTIWNSSSLGLTGEMEVCIPKSINRLRLKGSGSRFVHGGVTLQEVVIPVLQINKKRQSDVLVVEIEILRGANSSITTGQLSVMFYQAEAVTEKIQPRSLRAGIYTQAGDLISDTHELTFDLSSENPRDRELALTFLLTRKAEDANGQEVLLRLDENLPGTSHYREYKSIRYTLHRIFTSDFDL